jgi:hypothetical protein
MDTIEPNIITCAERTALHLLQVRKLILPRPRHIRDLDILVPLLGQRRAARRG